VIKNEEDDGWAVEMTRHGDPEPALVGPWTMGRDKKNPKPLDGPAFSTLVKTAAEVIRRHEQQLHATLNKSVTVTARDGPAHSRGAGHRARRGQPLGHAERARRRRRQRAGERERLAGLQAHARAAPPPGSSGLRPPALSDPPARPAISEMTYGQPAVS
jgi:hypothetical protein